MLRDNGERHRGRIDWWGNITFAVGLSAVLIAITQGIQPYHGHAMGWTNPVVVAMLAGGLILLAVFAVIETRIAEPMFQLALFRIRAFTAGNIAGLAVSIARGGLQFMLIIWLQGIWLPLHGYDYSQHAPVGRHLPVAADRRHPDRRADLGLAVRPVRRPRHRDRRDGGVRRQLHRPDAAAGELPLLGVRADHRAERDRRRHVRRTELLLDHGQRAGQAPGRGLGHARDLPELRHRAVDRGVLLPDDRRAGEQPAEDPDQRPAAAGRPGRARAPGRQPCRRSPRCSPPYSA